MLNHTDPDEVSDIVFQSTDLDRRHRASHTRLTDYGISTISAALRLAPSKIHSAPIDAWIIIIISSDCSGLRSPTIRRADQVIWPRGPRNTASVKEVWGSFVDDHALTACACQLSDYDTAISRVVFLPVPYSLSDTRFAMILCRLSLFGYGWLHSVPPGTCLYN